MPTLTYLLARRLAKQIVQELAQETEQEKFKTFRLEQFLKKHKRTKKGSYTWKSLQHYNDKHQH